MATTLDLKQPTVVMVGHWNSAILNEPAWIALHILGKDAGQEIKVQQIVTGNRGGQNQFSTAKQIWLFDDFGISCSPQRLEIFLRDIDQLAPINELITKLAQKLPHTPVKAIGVNFNYTVEGDISATVAQFETGESLDTIGTTLAQDRTDSIQIPEENLIEYEDGRRRDAVLKLSRNTDFNSVHMYMNYHQDLPDVQMLEAWCKSNPINHWKIHAEEILKSTYEVEEISAIYF